MEIAEREQLILKHLPQVKYIAQRVSAKLPSHIETGDLVGAGLLGLLDAVKKFDSSRGIKFKTYAEIRIKGAIGDSLRNLDWVPRNLRINLKKVGKAKVKLQANGNHEPTEEEISSELGIAITDLRRLTNGNNNFHLVSLDSDHGSDSRDREDNKKEIVADTADPTDKICLDERRKILAWAIDKLSGPQRRVISMYYYDELTMKEVGVALGKNESRISQIHSEAVRKIERLVKNYIYCFTPTKPAPIVATDPVCVDVLLSATLAKLEEEIAHDTHDLSILKRALAICRRFK